MLTFKEYLKEALVKEHHTGISFLGASPITHMGHAKDIGDTLKSLPVSTRHIGLSTKADLYDQETRKNIFQKQIGKDVKIHSSKGPGDVIRAAYDSLPEGKKVLHLVLGKDREDFGRKLVDSIKNGKIKELEGKRFSDVKLHTPEDENRSHGMSGTKMRQAAADSDLETFHKHLGSMFSVDEAKVHMKKIKAGIDSGTIELKRK